jgi:uncharacterized protein
MKIELDKKVAIAYMLDFYGAFLTEKQRNLMNIYYEQDLSLSEIAEQEGISRQGVHDTLKRGEKALSDIEEKLGILDRYLRTREYLENAKSLLEKDQIQIKELIDKAINSWEENE